MHRKALGKESPGTDVGSKVPEGIVLGGLGGLSK